MKRILAVLAVGVLVLVTASPVLAFEAGTFRVAGGATLASTSVTVEDTGGDLEVDTTTLVLSGGYFFSPTMEAGLTLISDVQDIEGSEFGTDILVPYFNYYLPVDENFVRFGVGYQSGTFKLGDDIDVTGFLVRAGYIVMLNEMLSVDIDLVYEDTEWELGSNTVDATGTTLAAAFSLYF